MANEEVRIANIETVLKAAWQLFLENGLNNTTREMIARASGISRRSTERYFPSMTNCIVQTAEWYGKGLYDKSKTIGMMDEGKATAAEVLQVFFDEIKNILFEEPRIFACYAEFKAHLYRNSSDSEADYTRFMEAVGCRRVLTRIFTRGELDGTVRAHYEPEANARYLINTIVAVFCNTVLLYGSDPERMKSFINVFLEDTWNIYCKGQW